MAWDLQSLCEEVEGRYVVEKLREQMLLRQVSIRVG